MTVADLKIHIYCLQGHTSDKEHDAYMQDREHVVLPRQPDRTSEALFAKLSIAKVMESTSQTLWDCGLVGRSAQGLSPAVPEGAPSNDQGHGAT